MNGLSLVTFNSEEFTQCSSSFEWEGGRSIISFTWVKLTFPYIFLLVDCFEWALIGHIEQWRVHSVLWQFCMGGREVHHQFYLGKTDFSLYFPISLLFGMGSYWSHWTMKISNGLSLVTLKSEEFTQCSGSFEWEGGREVHHQFYPGKTDFSLYFPISWLFLMGSHWSHWTAKSSLCALAVSNGGVYCQFYPGKTDFPYIFLLDDFSLYFPISWLFRMGSHWSHWTVKSSLCPLAVSNRGGGSPSSVLPG